MTVTIENNVGKIVDVILNGRIVAVYGLSGGLTYIKGVELSIKEIDFIEDYLKQPEIVKQVLSIISPETVITPVELTELELTVLDAIKEGDDFDNKPCNCIGNITDITQMSSKVVRGVLSSLIKKGLVTTGEYPNGMTAFYFEAKE